ncbi:MAG: FAD-dependent oxidoreductase [Synergistes sp.]|nr:FAD-dependent oxidoreductase [Synergistes sp.]
MLAVVLSLVICAFSVLPVSASEQKLHYDIAVIGAGCSGSAAAIQAARMGKSVGVFEESDLVGGQITASAVCSLDDIRLTRTGIYNEFITRIREHYDADNTPVNICLWGNDTIATEPWVAQKILLDMFRETGKIHFYPETVPMKVKKQKNRVESVVFKDKEGKEFTITADVFIDATEAGDFIPMTGARYRSGNSLSPKIDRKSFIQYITYVAVVKKYPNGVPDELVMKYRPPKYEQYAEVFRKNVTQDGGTWPCNRPLNIPSHNAYRALPDISNPDRGKIKGRESSSWKLISRTCINFANDYPGHDSGLPGMPTRYLEDKKYRLEMNRLAMEKTLAFIYYMQNELGMTDWSVDNRQCYGGWFCNDWQNWDEMPKEFAPILECFPPLPYIRESRRIVGLYTMTAKDVLRDHKLKRTLSSKTDSIALGEYPTDIHGLRNTELLDKDLNEKADDIQSDGEWKGGIFQIPMRSLIPEKVDGLLAAEKNISVSRIVNGSIRLHPVTMHTGQAAGALAAIASDRKIQPRNVPALAVQWALLNAKDRLSTRTFEDVPVDSDSWRAVELAMIYGYMDAPDEHLFGVDYEMHWPEIRHAFREAFGLTEMKKVPGLDTVSKNDFRAWLIETFGKDAVKYRAITDKLTSDDILTKGELAQTIAGIKLTNELK